MKKFLLALQLFLLFVTVVEAQEINEDRVSVHTIIQEGRNKMVNKILSGNHNEAIQIWQKLNNDFGHSYLILYPRERSLVALASRRFKVFADSARSYHTTIEKGIRAYIYDDFQESLRKYILQEKELILNQLKKSDLPEQEMDLVLVYIHFLENENAPSVQKKIKEFERKHKTTFYHNFLDSLRRRNLNSRINFSAGYNSEWLGGTNGLSNYHQFNTFKIELDGFIRKTYLSLYIGGGFNDINLTQSIREEDNNLFKAATKKISSQKYGFKLGRVLVSNHALKLYPYLSVGGFEIITSSSEDVQPATGVSNTFTSSFFAGGGLSCDLVLKRWARKKMYESEGYFFLRPNIGYDRFLKQADTPNRNNLYYSLSFGVSIGPR